MENSLKVIKFTAPWCQPCKAFSPIISNVCKELGIPVENVDVEEDQQRAINFNIRGVPTVVVLNKNTGEEVDRKVGALSEDKLRESLKEL